MLVKQINFSIDHANESYLVVYEAITGLTKLKQKPRGESGNYHEEIYSMPFICEDRKAAELFIQAHLNFLHRKA